MKVIAIIPVRGGSRGIPRKNARILHGRPLLAYTIGSALGSGVVDSLFVSTDDPELMEVARRYGASVLERPAALAADDIGLDAVIIDAVRALESRGETIDCVVSIQATSPLLKPGTIAAAVRKCIDEDLDTVLTVTNDTHLCWGLDADKHPIPLYEARVNRQYLPAVFRETGGVFVSRRSVLNTGTRFGEKVGLIELEKDEATDIDDRFDWWHVEKSLSRRRVCFHVVGNQHDGLGHVDRTLTLADRLIDHDLRFVVSDDDGLAQRIIKERFYPVRIAPRGEETRVILEGKPDMVINDILATSEQYMLELRQGGCPLIVNFDDSGQACTHADFVINEMCEEHPLFKPYRSLHGTSCCCLRDEFYSLPPAEVQREVSTVLLTFGGTDPNNLTRKCLDCVDRLEGQWRIIVLLGVGYVHGDSLSAFVETAQHDIEIVTDSNIVSRYMGQADLAVSGGGRTVCELASLGIPTIVISQDSREYAHVLARESLGVVDLGLATDFQEDRFAEVFTELLSCPALRQKMHHALLECDIRSGTERVLGVIQGLLNSLRQGTIGQTTGEKR